MKTTLLIKQHQKCQNILEMIETAEAKIRYYKEDLNTCFAFVSRDWTRDQLHANIAIRSRLINYYANTFTKMCQSVNV